jgi:hypothetical protein
MKIETIDDLTIGVRYKVTKQSDDETFLLNEIIERNDNSDILGYDAAGWIDTKDVEQTLKGLEVELHKDYAVKRILKLHEEIKKLYYDYNIIESDFLTEEDFDELDKLNQKLKEEKE